MSELSARERVEAELDELESKRSKLSTFMMSRNFEALNERQRELMISQLVAMSKYASILLLRLENWE